MNYPDEKNYENIKNKYNLVLESLKSDEVQIIEEMLNNQAEYNILCDFKDESCKIRVDELDKVQVEQENKLENIRLETILTQRIVNNAANKIMQC